MKSTIFTCVTVTALFTALAIPLALTAQNSQKLAPTFSVLYRFTGGSDGAAPKEDFLLRDNQGNLYGTTSGGGASNAGVVFRVNAISGKETALYSFTGGTDGSNPYTGLVHDGAGNLYGTTCCGGLGAGVVFKLDTTGKETPLYTFTGGSDGAAPYSGLIRDSAGNLYGTGTGGGEFGWGVVFKVSSTGSEEALYNFTGGGDGGDPGAALVHDNAGNLYGTTAFGGFSGCYSGCGVVFELTPAGVEIPLYRFNGGSDGANPYQGLIRDSAGNLYGTTISGGLGYGVVFKLTPSGTETVLYSFTGGTDGANPYATLVRDAVGNLYGTTSAGGGSNYGVVFKLDRNNHETVLYSFTGGGDGASPRGALFRDSAGNLYGTTQAGGLAGCGGLGCGVVFKITP